MFPAAINQRYFTISETETALQYVELSMPPKPARQKPDYKAAYSAWLTPFQQQTYSKEKKPNQVKEVTSFTTQSVTTNPNPATTAIPRGSNRSSRWLPSRNSEWLPGITSQEHHLKALPQRTLQSRTHQYQHKLIPISEPNLNHRTSKNRESLYEPRCLTKLMERCHSSTNMQQRIEKRVKF